MPKITYTEKRFQQSTLDLVDQANVIIDEYLSDGYKLTVRQLYYQFVARGLLANTVKNYKRLAGIISDARLAGMVDWSAIEDRTRNLVSQAHWNHPGEIIQACADQFRVDLWKGQPCRPEVWIEKEALAGVFDRICKQLDIPFFSCRGYTSQSEMWSNACRLGKIAAGGQRPIILHFGDHDPSGIDMTRDIVDRMNIFDGRMDLYRLALNMDQVEEFTPPPNPAKVTDSRFDGYVVKYGAESWELDALDPKVLAGLVESHVTKMIDMDIWNQRLELQQKYRDRLRNLSENWGE
jgi:hypothetical protein